MTSLPSLVAVAVSRLALIGAALTEPGVIHTYERSHTDGSNLETISVFHAEAHRVDAM
jgi:hypothetical protein